MTKLAKLPDYGTLLKLVAEGTSILQACRILELDRTTLYRHRKSHPDLDAEFRFAEEVGCEAQADEILDVHHSMRDPLMARVWLDGRKFILSTRQRHRYGDKLTVETQQNADLTQILKAAIERIPRPALVQSCDQPLELEAEKVTVSDIFGD